MNFFFSLKCRVVGTMDDEKLDQNNGIVGGTCSGDMSRVEFFFQSLLEVFFNVTISLDNIKNPN